MSIRPKYLKLKSCFLQGGAVYGVAAWQHGSVGVCLLVDQKVRNSNLGSGMHPKFFICEILSFMYFLLIVDPIALDSW